MSVMLVKSFQTFEILSEIWVYWVDHYFEYSDWCTAFCLHLDISGQCHIRLKDQSLLFINIIIFSQRFKSTSDRPGKSSEYAGREGFSATAEIGPEKDRVRIWKYHRHLQFCGLESISRYASTSPKFSINGVEAAP